MSALDYQICPPSSAEEGPPHTASQSCTPGLVWQAGLHLQDGRVGASCRSSPWHICSEGRLLLDRGHNLVPVSCVAQGNES